MAHNPECGLDCVSAGAVRLDNQAKHTPGPWVTGGFYIKSHDGKRMIADVTCGDGMMSEIDKANAFLLAASPTMLQALRQVRRFVETKLHSDDTAGFALGIIDHAIDQAEGRDR